MFPTTINRGPRPKMPFCFCFEEVTISSGRDESDGSIEEVSEIWVELFLAFLLEDRVSVDEVGAELDARRVSTMDSGSDVVSGSGVYELMYVWSN